MTPRAYRSDPPRVSTGSAGLDDLLGGGLDAHQIQSEAGKKQKKGAAVDDPLACVSELMVEKRRSPALGIQTLAAWRERWNTIRIDRAAVIGFSESPGPVRRPRCAARTNAIRNGTCAGCIRTDDRTFSSRRTGAARLVLRVSAADHERSAYDCHQQHFHVVLSSLVGADS
jgi:hypothetical protein